MLPLSLGNEVPIKKPQRTGVKRDSGQLNMWEPCDLRMSSFGYLFVPFKIAFIINWQTCFHEFYHYPGKLTKLNGGTLTYSWLVRSSKVPDFD
jgi:hypothetical protein